MALTKCCLRCAAAIQGACVCVSVLLQLIVSLVSPVYTAAAAAAATEIGSTPPRQLPLCRTATAAAAAAAESKRMRKPERMCSADMLRERKAERERERGRSAWHGQRAKATTFVTLQTTGVWAAELNYEN